MAFSDFYRVDRTTCMDDREYVFEFIHVSNRLNRSSLYSVDGFCQCGCRNFNDSIDGKFIRSIRQAESIYIGGVYFMGNFNYSV